MTSKDHGPHDAHPPLGGDTAPASKARLYGVGLAGVALVSALTLVFRDRRLSGTETERKARVEAASLGARILVGKVERTGGQRTVTLPGELHPLHLATLYAKTAGYLETLLVDKGDNVREGQVLGRIASPETDQMLGSAKAELLLRRQKQRRLVPLVKSGIVSQQEMDEADAALASAQAEHDRIQSLKGYEVLLAPFDGVVTARYVDPGALLSAATSSTTAAQPIVELQQMKTVRIFVYLAQRQAARVQAGDKAKVTSPDLPGLALSAEVTRTARAIDPRSRTMLVEVDVDNSSGKLTPGMFVEVSLTIDVPQGLQVPTDAIYLRGGKTFVMAVENGKALQRAVEAGMDDGAHVEILSGLKEGDLVGLHVGDDINDGVAVRPMEAKKAEK